MTSLSLIIATVLSFLLVMRGLRRHHDVTTLASIKRPANRLTCTTKEQF
jgi:hypothetical protein